MNDGFRHVDWSLTANIYEVNLRQYTSEGTIKAFSGQMSRLREMGIEILWFMPITPISVEKRLGSLGSYYACSDYTAVNPEFGSLDDFAQLVKDAHGLGMKVIIDIVANHTGWDHRWTREHPDYYRRNDQGKFFDSNGWEDVIDLNYDNPDLRQAMIGVMRFWIEQCDVDGFRCDMAMLVPLDFWRQARVSLDPLKPLFWLAECEEVRYHEVFDATYTWKLLHMMEAVWRKESALSGLDEVLGFYASQFPADGLRVYFTSNHDENSHSGSEYERLGDSAKAFAVLCATWDGLPMIYSGQELPNYKRLKFFDRDPIEWTGRFELNDFYKALLALRKRNAALRAGEGSAAFAEASADKSGMTRRIYTGLDDRCFGYVRSAGDDEVAVVLNFSAEWVKLDTMWWGMRGAYKDIFTLRDWKLPASIDVSPWGYAVIEKQKG
jgi:alpha-amylase